ncbi:MAG: hypothetical protein ACD_78C00067G0001, partial [uncultured bacterium (gcode 4)]
MSYKRRPSGYQPRCRGKKGFAPIRPLRFIPVTEWNQVETRFITSTSFRWYLPKIIGTESTTKQIVLLCFLY